MKVYLYGTPGYLGGAATKIRHLLRLLHKEMDFTVILTHPSWRKNKQVMGFLKKLNIPHCMNQRPAEAGFRRGVGDL